MKHFIKILVILLFSVNVYSQSTTTPTIVTRSQPANTVLDSRLYVDKNFRLPIFSDTVVANTWTVANSNKGLDSAGEMIYTRDIKGTWIRQDNPKRWVRVGSGGGAICSASVVNSTTIKLCDCLGSCINITVGTITVTAQIVYVKNDTTITVCDSLQHCQDVHIPKQQFSIYQNGLVNLPNNIIELGASTPFGSNPLVHDTYLWTNFNKLNIVGWKIYDYPLQVSHTFWSFENGTGLQSWLGGQYLTPTNLDYANKVPIGVDYTSSLAQDTGGHSLPGYFRNSIGYTIGTNLTGNGAYGERVFDPLSKFGGAFFHTLDTLYKAVVTIYGGRPPHSNFVADIGADQTLDSNRIVSFQWDKDVQWYGYDSLRNDYSTTKALFVDAHGLMKYGTISNLTDTFSIATRALVQKKIDSVGGLLTSYTPTSRTLTHSNVYGLNIVGGTQTFAANRTWTYAVDTFSVASKFGVKKEIDSVSALIKTYTGSNGITLTSQNFTWEGDLTKNTTVGNAAETHSLTLNASSYTLLKTSVTNDNTKVRVLMIDGGTGTLYYRDASTFGTGGGSVTDFSSGNLSPLFTTSVAASTTTPALTFSLSNAAANTYFGNSTSGSTTPSHTAAGALTKVDDTNVTLTLGGSPTVSLLKATSLTLGWTGVLAYTRGGTGTSSIGTVGQLVKVNAAANGYDFFTPTYISGNQSITWTASNDVSGSASGTTSISPSLTVTGIRSATIPALSTGNLRYNGGWSFDNTTYLSSITANNGLNISSGANVQMGGDLTTNTTIGNASETHTLTINAATYALMPSGVTLDSTKTRVLVIDGSTGQIYYRPASSIGSGGGGSGSVTEVTAGNFSPLFTTTVTNSTTTPSISFTATSAAANKWFGNNTGSSAASAFNSIGALTKTDDTNVTLTLGGSPTTALLNAASLTLGWTGVLSIARGGTNNGSLSVTNGSIVYTDGSKQVSLAIGTANQLLRTNGAGTLPEWFTPSYGTVTSFSSGNLSPLFTTSVSNASTTPALSFSLSNAAAFSYLGNGASASAAPSYTTASAISKTDDTNITLTLGGTYTSSVLQPVSLTLGWAGSLSIARGGTNNGSLAVTNGSVLYTDGTKIVSLGIGTSGQVLQSNGTVPSWVTPSSGGSVTNFSAGNLSPLFTTSVATSSTTPALSFSLSNAASTTVFGNFTNGSTSPSFNAATADGQLLVRRSGALTFATLTASDIPISLTTTGSSGVSTYNSSTGVLNIPNYVTPPAGSNTQIQFNNSGAFGASGNFIWTNSTAQEEITGSAYVHTSSTNPAAGTYTTFATNTYTWTATTSQLAGNFYGTGSVLTDHIFSANMTLNAASVNSANQNTLRLGSTSAAAVTVQQTGVRALSANAVSVNMLLMPSALGSSIDWVAGMQIYAVQPASTGTASNLMMTITNYVGLLLADSREYSNVSTNITNSYGVYQKGTSDKNFFNGTMVFNNVPSYSSGGYNLAVVNTGSGRVESVSAGSIGAAGSVYGETPSGSINGSNVTFTIANTPVTGTVRVYLNGQRITGYSVSSTTITMTTAPLSGDTILIDYNK